VGCAHPKPSDEEEKTLAMFQAILKSLEGNVSPRTFNQLLGQAESNLTLLKQNPRTPPCFLKALDKCYASYQIIGKALQKRLEPLDPMRKEDCDMALSFSSAFAALSLQSAMDCYKL
jgi:hypothetical protein